MSSGETLSEGNSDSLEKMLCDTSEILCRCDARSASFLSLFPENRNKCPQEFQMAKKFRSLKMIRETL